MYYATKNYSLSHVIFIRDVVKDWEIIGAVTNVIQNQNTGKCRRRIKKCLNLIIVLQPIFGQQSRVSSIDYFYSRLLFIFWTIEQIIRPISSMIINIYLFHLPIPYYSNFVIDTNYYDHDIRICFLSSSTYKMNSSSDVSSLSIPPIAGALL